MADPSQLDLLGGGAPEVAPAVVTEEAAGLARAMPAAVRLGTSSWTFPGWADLVYARAESKVTLARAGLAAYARHPLLRTVSVDRAYYGPLDVAAWREYARQVPGDFRFLVKAPRAATVATLDGQRNPRFLDPEAVVGAIGAMVEGLADRLGPVVFQFPPGRHDSERAFAERLHGFLRGLPAGPLYAVEIRSQALLGAHYAAALANAGAVHCYSVHPGMPSVREQARRLGRHRTGAFVARWNLGGGQGYEEARRRYYPFDRIVDPDPETRDLLARGVREALQRGVGAWVIANNKAEGSAPLSVIELARAVRRT